MLIFFGQIGGLLIMASSTVKERTLVILGNIRRALETWEQGDPIGRTFADGQLFTSRVEKVSQILGYLFPRNKLCIII
jgi:hypothetical protein